MGGAERNARRKKQTQAAKAVAAARASNNDRTKVIIGVVVVVVLLGAVVGGVLYTRGRSQSQAAAGIPTQAVSVNYPVRRQDGVVVAGKDTAKVTVDIYEDFLCPGCGGFEKRDGASVDKQLESGAIKVRYHMLPMLNDNSNPPGYSLDSANAGLCAADANKFTALHASLFARQPEEGSRGFDTNQLAKLGADLGISGPDFATCVTGGKYNQMVIDGFTKAGDTPFLQTMSPKGKLVFRGTPTVAVGEKLIDTTDATWLDKLVRGKDS